MLYKEIVKNDERNLTNKKILKKEIRKCYNIKERAPNFRLIINHNHVTWVPYS